MAALKPLVAGNWKMHGVAAALAEIELLKAGIAKRPGGHKADVMVCPPATLLSRMAERIGGAGIAVGGQDCHTHATGAHTGCISAEMLKDAGASAVIVGHSERRSDNGETSGEVRAKAQAAHRAGLLAIVCVGETAGERSAGLTLAVVRRQLTASLPAAFAAGDTVIAYEPVWAIGTGMTPTAEDVATVHAAIRARLVELNGAEGGRLRILYGGSVKPSNARELMAVADVDGALVGGASLKAADFLGILAAYG